MRKYKYQLMILPVSVLAVALLLMSKNSGIANSASESRRELLVKVVTFAINNGHYNPVNIDDAFSELAFDLYIKMQDYNKRFFLKQDVDRLARYRHKLDDAFLQADFEFFDLSVELLGERTSEVDHYYHEILQSPFDFTKPEEAELDPEKLDFAETHAGLKERWRLALKYETLVRLHELLETQEKEAAKSDTVTIKSFEQLEEEARTKILERYDDWFHRLEEINENDRISLYVNALVNVFDPHTQYFPPRDKENFDIRISGQLEGIGAQLIKKNIYVEVYRIVPGSPSWKQGELEVGDQILKVKQENEDPVDIVDMRLDDAVQLIRGPKGSTVILTVKKISGIVKDIDIVRDVVVLEETYAKSAIIPDPESDKKIGYIKLPSFYVDFENKNGRRCSEDIRIELEKLNEEGVDGIVFDLRNNGGGSLEDVVKIAGLFIDQGPIVQVHGKGNVRKILRDSEPGYLFGGPLVVMVNPVSASASEIFAAAMQDYERALVIGSASTYGKGTVQNFTELDRMVSRPTQDTEPLGSLKITVQKFYRINGGTTQLRGVIPDIIVPDYFNYIDYGEKDLDHAMEWTETQQLTYKTWEPLYDPQYIIDIATNKLAQDTLFALIDENGKRFKEQRDNTRLSLHFDRFKEENERRQEEGKRFEKIGKDTLGLQPRSLAVDVADMAADTAKIARNNAWLTNLKKDTYLKFACEIMGNIPE